jgi:hypothetical protein
LKILLYILCFLIGTYLWNALDQIYWTIEEKNEDLQLNIQAHRSFTPLKMEREVVRSIEYILNDFEEVKSYSSFISGHQTRVVIQLKNKTDIESFKIRINERFRQNWEKWKLKIKYPTWEKAINDNRHRITYAGITTDEFILTKEALQKLLKQEAPHLSIDQFNPIKEQEFTLLLSKSKLNQLQLKLNDLNNQLTNHFQRIPPLVKLLNTTITNPVFMTETLFYLSGGKTIQSNPSLWVQGQPAYRIDFSYKRSFRQLLRNNNSRRLSLNDQFILYPLHPYPHPTFKKLKWSLYLLLCVPIIVFPFIKLETILLILSMQFSLFTTIIHFSQVITFHLLALFMSAMVWPFLLGISKQKLSFISGYIFLFGGLTLFNYRVSPDYNLALIAAVLGSWTLIIKTYEYWVKNDKKSNQKFPTIKVKHLWVTFSFLGLICGFLWYKNKNNFFEKNTAVHINHSNPRIQLAVTLYHGTNKFKFGQKLLILLNQIQRLPEVKTIILDTRIPGGILVTIDLKPKAKPSENSKIRDELERFMLENPNQTFVLEGLGKELAQSSAIINRGVYLVLKGFHYPALLKQALVIQEKIKENRRVTQTYFGHTIGPSIATSHENVLIKASSKNKVMIGRMLDNWKTQNINLDFEDSTIKMEMPSLFHNQWTKLFQVPFYLNQKLITNPLTPSKVENYDHPSLIFKKNGIFELVIGFSFLGSKRQAQSFLKEKQQAINKTLPFGLYLENETPLKKKDWLNLVGGMLILSGFVFILDQNHYWLGVIFFGAFILTFFVGHWLFVAVSSSYSIIPSLPLLSYWMFSICQTYGAILFKSE